METHRNGVLPWTRSCFVCGEANPYGFNLRSRIEGEKVVLDYTTQPRDLGWRHLVHGGIAAALMDEVMTWAAILASRRACVAAEITTRLKHPIRVGCRLRIEGTVSRGGARLVLTQSEIRDQDGRVLASATGKYMPMPEDELRASAEDFVADDRSIRPQALFAPPPPRGNAESGKRSKD